MAKKSVGKFLTAFQQYAVERLKQCKNIVALTKELRVHRRLLYRWRDQREPAESGDGLAPEDSRETTLRKEKVSRLKRALAEKTLELDFFTGALREVKARRQRRGNAGETASTPTSGT